MRSLTRYKEEGIIFRGGKPIAVILPIKEYQELLKRLEDAEDLRILKRMRKRPLKFRRLSDFLREYKPGVRIRSGG